MKFKVGDEIIVKIGKDKGKKGKIEKVFPKVQKVLIPGVNMFKKHAKRKDDKNPGGIVDIVRPINVAKIAIICKNCGKETRVGFLVSKNGKERICRKCDQKI